MYTISLTSLDYVQDKKKHCKRKLVYRIQFTQNPPRNHQLKYRYANKEHHDLNSSNKVSNVHLICEHKSF